MLLALLMNFVVSRTMLSVLRRTAVCMKLRPRTCSSVWMRRSALPLVRGVQAYAQGRFDDAADTLAAVRDVAHRFGGSHAQRDVISLTLIDAAARAGRRGAAQHFLNEREMFKPASEMGRRLLHNVA